tara:strand:- start:71 stop:550 length:480 start_codon:yes stop_codon:yes gene_type:complete
MRKKFGLAGVVTKAATKAAEKIKKINKKDISTFTGVFKKQMKALKALNKPAVDEYKKTVAEIKSRITKGEGKTDMKDLQAAQDKLQSKLFKGSKDLVKRYEGLPDIRSRFRGAPGRQRRLVKGVKNPMKRAEILQKDRLQRYGGLGLKKYKAKKFTEDR